MRGIVIATMTVGVVWLAQSRASAWDPFLVENDHVEAGNARMAERDAAGALEHYDAAARELPDHASVHLNRGLALLEAGELDRAREAFRLATEPPADPNVRADAHYDLGLAFYRQADAVANAAAAAALTPPVDAPIDAPAPQVDHREAQRLFREAADAFRESLRIRPGNADAGWNLELAIRRLREQEEQQRQQQEREEQEKQDQQDQDEDQQNQDQQDQDQNQDQQSPDQQDQDQQNQDQQDQDQQDQQSQDPESQDSPNEGQGDSPDEQEPPPMDDGAPEGGEDDPQEQPPSPDDGSMDQLPPEHRRVLDALEQGEESLERHRARIRAEREGRRVEQDW